MKSWNLLAEVLGFLSACMLLWPAVTNNTLLRRVAMTSKVFKEARTALGKRMSNSKTLDDATRPRWSPLDQWLISAGALLLVASFAVKCWVVWNSP
jgi:hypothetical protein